MKQYLPFLTFLLLSQFTFSQTHPFTQAKWITTGYAEDSLQRPCPVFKKNFGIKGKIKSATLYITALGLYEAQINGKRVGADYFTPGFTDYDKRLQYQQYDVSKLIGQENEINITVGDGWYRGVFRGEKPKNNYGSKAGVLLELVIEYQDGVQSRVVSDPSWRCAPGPIRSSELYDGELLDLGYTAKNWSDATLLNQDTSQLIPSETAPVRKHEIFKPGQIFLSPKGEQIIDFKQNIAGWVKLYIKGKKGDTIRISHAEVLDKDGNFFTGNLRTAKATDTYVLNGNGTEILEPHFTYHGFRYVKVEGFTATKSNIEAIALYSDLKKTGTFICSNPLINQLQSNIEWSLNSNFFDIPTDCPQRSERLGWTGDAQVFAPTASFLRDTRTFYSKWLKDLAAEQGKNGGVPTYIPTVQSYQEKVAGVAGWSDAAVVVPWTVFEVYGDTSVLRNQYTSMKGWVDYIQNSSPDGLWKSGGYGDWYAPGPKTSLPLIDQCYWAYSTSLLIKTAKVLGKTVDQQYYSKLLGEIRNRFVDSYLNANGQLISDTQTAYILALQFDLIPAELKQKSAARLAELIHANNDHLATGFLGTPYLLQVLSDNGYADLAYTLLNQQTYPSWLYPIKMGATTIWEKWDGITPDGQVQATSYNHYSYGAVGNWLYRYVAGINAADIAYSKIIISPKPGGGLTWAKASYECSYGTIVSDWKIENGKIRLKVEIPRGTTATIVLPGQAPIDVKAGKYHYEAAYPAKL